MIELFKYDEILKALKSESIGFVNGSVTKVVIDSREASSGSLFIPLIGEVTDGNLYIEGALKKGCRCSLVSTGYYTGHKEKVLNLSREYGSTFFIVDDGLKALHILAAAYIDRFKNLKVISITGSSGKTTTKEILGSILKGFKSTLITEGNYNSETGLPLTVFRIRDDHEIAVLEIGMNRPGEIKALVDIIFPDISIITNIGSAHIGFFGTREKIAGEKKDAFANFTGNNLAIIPAWDDYYEYLKDGVNGTVLSVIDNPNYITGVENRGFNGWEFYYEGLKVNYPYMGHYNFLNALIAISCARELCLPRIVVVKGLENLPSMFGRGEILTGRNRVIRDCYNANPDSTLKSLKLLEKTVWEGEKIPIIGSMLELGDKSFDEHIKIVKFAAGVFSNVILCGDEFEEVFNSLGDELGIHFFKDLDSLKLGVDRLIKPGSLVLLKASRGVQLENISDNLL